MRRYEDFTVGDVYRSQVGRTVTETDNGRPTVYATLTVTRTGDTTGTSTVNWATVAGSANAGSDFTAASGTLTFAASQSSKTITITIASDKKAEPTETFTVVLSSPTGATIAGSTGTVTILDNDGSLMVSSAGASGDAVLVSDADASRVLSQSIAAWLATGVSHARLANLTVIVTDLPGLKLAEAIGDTITIDIDAAGWGWDRLDLGSVLLHEVGHVLGYEHTDFGLMAATIEPGTVLSIDDDVSSGRVPPTSPVVAAAAVLGTAFWYTLLAPPAAPARRPIAAFSAAFGRASIGGGNAVVGVVGGTDDVAVYAAALTRAGIVQSAGWAGARLTPPERFRALVDGVPGSHDTDPIGPITWVLIIAAFGFVRRLRRVG